MLTASSAVKTIFPLTAPGEAGRPFAMGLALAFGCFPVKPAAATILALSFVFLNFILMNIPWFADLKPWFLTYHLNLWQQLYAQPVSWSRLGESLSLLAGFNATFFALGAAAFGVRDLKG